MPVLLVAISKLNLEVFFGRTIIFAYGHILSVVAGWTTLVNIELHKCWLSSRHIRNAINVHYCASIGVECDWTETVKICSNVKEIQILWVRIRSGENYPATFLLKNIFRKNSKPSFFPQLWNRTHLIKLPHICFLHIWLQEAMTRHNFTIEKLIRIIFRAKRKRF